MVARSVCLHYYYLHLCRDSRRESSCRYARNKSRRDFPSPESESRDDTVIQSSLEGDERRRMFRRAVENRATSIPRGCRRGDQCSDINAEPGNEIIAWNKQGNNFMPPRASSQAPSRARALATPSLAPRFARGCATHLFSAVICNIARGCIAYHGSTTGLE